MKKFENPELEVQIFNTEDIMTESTWDTPGAGFGS